MLTLLAMDQSYGVYFGLPDNPYVTREEYVHPHPFRLFDMKQDECVLIGHELWDHLGGLERMNTC